MSKITEGGVRSRHDSNYRDKSQLDRISKEISASGSEWKIAFPSPLYSS